MTSVNSLFSHRSFHFGAGQDTENAKKKQNWLRSSIRKAFNRTKTPKKSQNSDNDSDVSTITKRNSEQSEINFYGGNMSLPTSPMHHNLSLLAKSEHNDEVYRQLRDKESKLTDIRLEALATAHHLDQLKEEYTKMKVKFIQINKTKQKKKL